MRLLDPPKMYFWAAFELDIPYNSPGWLESPGRIIPSLERSFLVRFKGIFQNVTKKELRRMRTDPHNVVSFVNVFFEFGLTVLFIVPLKSLTYTPSEKQNVVCSKKKLTHDRWLSRTASIAQACFLWWAKSNFLLSNSTQTKILIHWNILTS